MSQPIRVVVLNCEYPPLGGGAATATQRLIEEFASLPVEADLVTSSASSEHWVDINEHCRGHFLDVGKKDIHYWTNRELAKYALRASAYVRELHQRRRFDVCHAFFTLPAGAAAWRLRRDLPYVVSLRGSDVPGFSGRYAALYRLGGFVFRRVWEDASAVTANSEDLAALARETMPSLAIEVIPNGVDTALFQPGEGAQRPPTVLTVARLIPRKDVATAVRAAALLAGGFENLRWIVVGDGPLESPLRSLAESLGVADRVEMRRYVPREEMPAVYRSADVFVLTSSREGMSNTILEALASGLPVVASREALSGIDFSAARIAATGDAEGVAKEVRALLADGEARREAGTAARSAAGRYTWSATARMLYGMYERVLAEGGSAAR